MSRLILFLPIVLVAAQIKDYTMYHPRDCGRHLHYVRPESIFGEDRKEPPSEEYPWMVYIAVPDGQSGNHYHCSGSLIDKRHVLTAGHCFRSKQHNCTTHYDDIAEVKVCHGTGYCENDADNAYFGVSIYDEIYVNSSCKDHADIVILTLDRDVTNSRPVCLPIFELERYTHNARQHFHYAGFSDNGRKSRRKLRVGNGFEKVPCIESLQNSTFLCTSVDATTVGACDGDSGGSTMEMHSDRHVQIGVIKGTTGVDCKNQHFGILFLENAKMVSIDVIPFLAKICDHVWHFTCW